MHWHLAFMFLLVQGKDCQVFVFYNLTSLLRDERTYKAATYASLPPPLYFVSIENTYASNKCETIGMENLKKMKWYTSKNSCACDKECFRETMNCFDLLKNRRLFWSSFRFPITTISKKKANKENDGKFFGNYLNSPQGSWNWTSHPV